MPYRSQKLSERRERELERRERQARHAAAALAWLDRAPRWHEGAAAWDTPGGLTRPRSADLELAAARLALLAALPAELARRAGCPPEQIAARIARLAEARALAAPGPADIPALAASTRAGDPAALAALAALLPAEAICRHGPRESPAAALAACGPAAVPALRAALADGGAPLPGRALAALALGALAAELDLRAPSLPPEAAALLRRAYGLGRERGMPAAPALAVAALAAPAGRALLERIDVAARRAGDLALPIGLLCDLRDAGAGPEELAALAEAPLAAVALAERMLPPPAPRRGRRARAARRRSAFVSQLAVILQSYLRASRDPQIVAPIVRLAEHMLELTGSGGAGQAAPAELALQPLLAGQSLPGPLMRPYLELIIEGRGLIWPPGAPADRARLLTWVRDRWWQVGESARDLVRRSGDVGLARRALARGLTPALRSYRLADPALYRWALGALDGFGEQQYGAACALMALLSRQPGLAPARAAVGPLLDALLAAPPALRTRLLVACAEDLPAGAAPLARRLRLMAGHIPALAAAGETVCSWAQMLIPALDLLDRSNPQGAAGLIAAALPDLADLLTSGAFSQGEEIRLAALLAAAVVPHDAAGFVAVLRALAGRRFDVSPSLAGHGAEALARLPGLAAAVARVLPDQPRRALALVEQVGRAAQLGPQTLAPLAELPPAREGELLAPALRSLSPGWRELLALAPQAEADAAAYLHAQWLLGGELAPPPAARRALELPARLAAERDYLERRLAAAPAPCRLAARLANLDGYLAAPDLWARAGGEAAERLAAAAVEATLAAATKLLEEGLRARLAASVGPLPAGLRLDADLYNAVLLLSDVSSGRELLLRAIRAHLAGDEGWRAALPENAAFLRELAGRGVDPAVWLGAWPAVYPLASAAGGRVRVALETRPLRVLQMGNLFDTCLSLGGANSFSAVTNAVDLNKRVLYAVDGAGQVIGRKLIAISGDWKLLGYHTYTRSGEPELAALIRRHLADFAARCGLELADAGSVPTLVARDWYDDGEEAWDGGEAATRPAHISTLGALAAHGLPLSRAELDAVVAGNDKQRFAFDEAGERIWASQGHSVEVDLGLEPPAAYLRRLES